MTLPRPAVLIKPPGTRSIAHDANTAIKDDGALEGRPAESENPRPVGQVSVDVLVVGGGNAGLCAAIAAREAGADVLLVEAASKEWRGGNSKYTRNIRCAHGSDPVMPGRYTPDELEADLMDVSERATRSPLATLVIEQSAGLPSWMERLGVAWQPPLNGTLQLARTNRFFLGGGKALVNTYYRTSERLGIRVAYKHRVEALHIDKGRCVDVEVVTPDGPVRIAPRAIVVASGGFEANISWLQEYWGEAARNYRIRGTRENDGVVLRSLLDQGAASRGDPHGFHAIAVDARSPAFEGGIVTRVDAIPFGVTVNRNGRRFSDEGYDLWPKRYASWGRLIADQPGQLAYSIFDSQVRAEFIPSIYPPFVAQTIGELAAQLDLPGDALTETLRDYNAAVPSPGGFDPTRLDGCSTVGLEPAKSNWALAINRPPYYAYPLRAGITFTYLGLAVDEHACVLTADGSPFANVFAAGEIMAGNILLRGYLAGFGLTIGTVFGRLAGESAARQSRTA